MDLLIMAEGILTARAGRDVVESGMMHYVRGMCKAYSMPSYSDREPNVSATADFLNMPTPTHIAFVSTPFRIDQSSIKFPDFMYMSHMNSTIQINTNSGYSGGPYLTIEGSTWTWHWASYLTRLYDLYIDALYI